MSAVRLILSLLLPVIAGCANHPPAPVEDRGGVQPQAAATTGSPVGYYTVKKGDTLYSIALDNGRDYKDIAAWNNLENPGLIKIGQQLRVTPPDNGASVAVTKPVVLGGPIESTPSGTQLPKPVGSNTETLKREPKGGKLVYSDESLAKARQGGASESPAEARTETKPAEVKPLEKPVVAGDDVDWMWPASGKLIASFAEGGGKGVDIAGKAGDPVLAAGSGVVSYAGAGLRGYGNLVVLRHNGTYLSVYAHNSKILVKEKQTVTKGQKIAEMGSTDAESPRLHFEIRRQGKPADPQKFLPAR
jgi:lipoprotein NlpD